MTTHKLRRHLGLLDLVLTQILCVVGSSWVGVAASLGPGQALTWVAAMLLFYLPMGAAVIYLSRAMPLEGGLYKWAQRAFGDLMGFMIAWNLWVYAIAVSATILFAIPSEVAFLLGPSAAWFPDNRLASLLLIFSLLILVTAATIRGLDIGKWIHNVGSVAVMAVYFVLMCLPFWAKVTGAPVHSTSISLHLPPASLFTMAIFGQMLVGALSGLEYVALLAGESEAPARTIGLSVLLASPLICSMFILGTSSVLAFQGVEKINFIAPIPQTLRWALGNTGMGAAFATGAIALLQLRLLGATSFLFTGATRLPMTAGWDHLIPAWFNRLHPRWLTPVNATIFSGGLIALLLVLGSAGVHTQEAYQVLSNASMTHYEIAYLAMFAIPVIGAKSLRVELPRWLKWSSVVGFCATLFSLAISAYPFVDVVDPRAYAVKVLGTTLVSNVVAYVFYRSRMGVAARSESELSEANPEPS